MGQYVQSQLIADEAVQYEAKAHWAIHLKGIIVIAIGILILTSDKAIGGGFIAIGTLMLISAMISAATTELVITNKRIIAKFGVIRRKTFEQQLSKVEGANLNQSFLGRMFGYASIVVRGTGSGLTPVPYIADPTRFQHELTSRIS